MYFKKREPLARLSAKVKFKYKSVEVSLEKTLKCLAVTCFGMKNLYFMRFFKR